MTASAITDPDKRAHVAALSNAVDFEASKARVASGRLDDAARRRRELRMLLGEHDAAEPNPEPDVADELSARLAADPATAGDDAWAGTLERSHADASARHAAWKAKRAVIERSIATVEAEMPALEGARDAARREHEAAWSAFVWGAHGALMAEFEREFAGMSERLLMPMRALETASGIYSGARLGYAGKRAIHGDSSLGVLVAPPPGSMVSGPAYEHLYPPRGMMPAGVIERLRYTLEEAPIGSGRRR